MKVFSSFHNPSTKKYIIYYSVVLVIISVTIFFTTLQTIHQNPLSSIMTFFEGFFSLFMLSRNKQVGNALVSHMSKLKGIIRLSLPSS
ncbi:MAG: hypothetical protein KGI10_03835 [Thaumarchaeota archaeon]|nr:hypothetical protein [Nitrososphaerota archaeon]